MLAVIFHNTKPFCLGLKRIKGKSKPNFFKSYFFDADIIGEREKFWSTEQALNWKKKEKRKKRKQQKFHKSE